MGEAQDIFKQGHEAKGLKLSLFDNPDDPTSKILVVLFNDAAKLGDNVGVVVERGVSRATSEDECGLINETQLLVTWGRGCFSEMARPSGLGETQCKRCRLQKINCDACVPEALPPDGGANAPAGDGAALGGDVPAFREAAAEDRPARCGYWIKLPKWRWGFVATFAECRADDDGESEGEVVPRGAVESALREMPRAIDLATIASGLNSPGHRGARLKTRRGQCSASSNQAEIDAAGLVAKRLDLAACAEDLAKPDLLRTLPQEVFEIKMAAMCATDMVLLVSLAVGISSRAALAVGAEMSSGSSEDVARFVEIVLPIKPPTTHAEGDFDASGGDAGFDWRGPCGCRVPGDPKSLVLVNVALHVAVSRTVQHIDGVLIKSMGDAVEEEVQLSVNSVVECLGAVQYVVDLGPLSFNFASGFDAMSSAEPSASDSHWRGLGCLFNERMSELPLFQSSVAPIRKTKV
ncbi:unnamed protein product, partial [Prorocentrum cordatum]